MRKNVIIRNLILCTLLPLGALVASCRLPVSDALEHTGGEASNYNFTLDYQVWLPEGYEAEPNRSYPLLVWFHGGGENELGWGRKGRIGEIVHQRVAKGEIQPFIVVSPSAGAFTPVFRTYDRLLVEEVLPEVNRKYRTNGVTVAFGHSMGGLSALMVSLHHPKLFKAVVAASPFVFDTSPWDTAEERAAFDAQYPSRFASRYRYEIGMNFDSRDRYREWAPYYLIRQRSEPLPFDLLITVGDQDPMQLYAQSTHLHELLLENHCPHEWYIQKGVGHGTVEDPHLMDWLNRKASP